jgi:lia operon protein LiaF
MKRWQLVLGTILVLIGLFTLVEVVFDIRLWPYIWPLILIGLGLLFLLRLQIGGQGVQVEMPLLGDIRKKGAWQVTQHEFWTLVGSFRFDLTEAVFPEGKASIKVFGFVPEMRIILPDDVGLRVETSAFVSEIRTLEGKREQFLGVLNEETENFATAEKQVVIYSLGFVSEVRIKPPLI